jgi:hypothetical protein
MGVYMLPDFKNNQPFVTIIAVHNPKQHIAVLMTFTVRICATMRRKISAKPSNLSGKILNSFNLSKITGALPK